MAREFPYGNFNFRVLRGEEEIGGFSDVSGLNAEINVAEYRDGNASENHVMKIPGAHKFENVTLKRGIVNSKAFWGWLDDTFKRGREAKSNMRIELHDESGNNPVQQWVLTNAMPVKYTGPSLSGAGGTEVAMEEWQIAYDKLELVQLV